MNPITINVFKFSMKHFCICRYPKLSKLFSNLTTFKLAYNITDIIAINIIIRILLFAVCLKYNSEGFHHRFNLRYLIKNFYQYHFFETSISYNIFTKYNHTSHYNRQRTTGCQGYEIKTKRKNNNNNNTIGNNYEQNKTLLIYRGNQDLSKVYNYININHHPCDCKQYQNLWQTIY